jgi:hypothetical protein
MTRMSRIGALILLCGGMITAADAQAQWYSSAPQSPAPLYPYAVPNNQAYAVQVAPNTYVIRRPGETPASRGARHAKPAKTKHAVVTKSRRSKVDHALIDELRQRGNNKTATINTTQVVHKKPIVKETKRYVDDPPRVVERYQVVDENGSPVDDKGGSSDTGAIVLKRKDGKTANNGHRVISAEAEITIIGPDRMNIRLFRKGSKARAQAD